MNDERPLAVALISGGLDSMVAAAWMRERGYRLLALSVDYNQRHQIELAAARRIAHLLGAERHVVLPIDLRAFGGSALTAEIEVPKDGIGDTIPVDLAIGVNALDYSGYPDCRPEFVAAFEAMAGLATKAGVGGSRFHIHTPLQHLSKADIVREGARLGLDMGLSWSCYDPAPGGLHCGWCDSCRLRAKGFGEAGVADPTLYAGQP